MQPGSLHPLARICRIGRSSSPFAALQPASLSSTAAPFAIRSSRSRSQTYHSSSAPTALSHARSLEPSALSSPGYGQPLPSTHPHLLAEGELTPGITAHEYELRRRTLMDRLDSGSIVVIAGSRLKYATAKIFYKFRQESNFWYLTGWEEPDSMLVLVKDSSLRGYKMVMFVPSKDANDEAWNGPRSGREGACQVFGADEAHDVALLSTHLKSIINVPSSSSSSHGLIYVDLPGEPAPSRHRSLMAPKKKSLFDYLVPKANALDETTEVLELLSGSGRIVKSANAQVEKLRLIKSEAEIKVMTKAAQISARAHAKVMRFCEPTSSSPDATDESSLVAHFEYNCALQGSPRPAYVPVCASGPSGLTIHYTSNRLPLLPNHLVNLDAGCEYAGYASDITRTFPVSGTFTTPQEHLYEVVLRVQKECIKLCTAEKGMTLEELHRRSVDIMRVELTDLGFHLRGGELERTLYPHFLTHPIGIDLHDTPGFSRAESIQAGMVITIEPGIFVPPQAFFPVGFHNTSVRVEDEILVRDRDQVILSVDAPKEVIDIEKTCQGYFDGLPGQ
ncbi:BQ2448_3784 [Microbotryum intermedium]|uniref:BQ2448_3784 protein n=1 Tax=Microbotryum intermedium TaxID=269621 RepID=A0A238FB01_9BASI|nr:BQ2448_3784 [Microbotryum intermedium]